MMSSKLGNYNRMRRIIAGMMMLMIIVANTNSRNEVFAYDREEAVKYASRHCTNYNSSYPKYGSDCTNFASQVLHAGGYKTNPVPNKDISYGDLGTV